MFVRVYTYQFSRGFDPHHILLTFHLSTRVIGAIKIIKAIKIIRVIKVIRVIRVIRAIRAIRPTCSFRIPSILV